MPVTLRLLGLKLSTRPEGAVVVYVNKSFKCYGVNLFCLVICDTITVHGAIFASAPNIFVGWKSKSGYT